jgi:hypothetical protein
MSEQKPKTFPSSPPTDECAPSASASSRQDAPGATAGQFDLIDRARAQLATMSEAESQHRFIALYVWHKRDNPNLADGGVIDGLSDEETKLKCQ